MIDKTILDELKSKYPYARLLSWEDDDTDETFEIVVAPPGRAQWQRFMRASTNDEERSGAGEQLVRDCTVYVAGAPSTERNAAAIALDAMLLRRPGLAGTFSKQLVKIAGLSREASSKKL